jgi:AAA+ superfamily predicted ATPase
LPEWNDEYQPALEILCRAFGLSSFERSILLLCAGVELYGDFVRLCAEAQSNSNAAYPTFGLALAAFPNPHWSALTPESALRRFGLIELASGSLMPLTSTPLRIKERVLHYLTGISYPEPALAEMIRPITENILLPLSHKEIVTQILHLCTKSNGNRMPVIQLRGLDEISKLAIAQNVCKEMGLSLWHLQSEMIQANEICEAKSFVKLWSREAVLLESGLYISAEDAEPAVQRLMTRIISDLPRPLFLGTRERWNSWSHYHVTIEVKKPTKMEQFDLWKKCIDESARETDLLISKLANQFDLNVSAILSVCAEADLLSQDTAMMTNTLWNACLNIARPKIAELAQQVISKASLEGLILPEKEKQILRDISVHVAHQNKVYNEWGFGSYSGRGLGITALFSGASGTGKTMAAEVLANELNLDLFRIDLSTVVDKYIGETEKNLNRLFDAAEEGGAILFFDEADAIFGKRIEVHDSRDRFANIEINYLLTRMESYRGLAILATNMKNSIDQAFLRRIRFIVNFPFPDEKSREEIWRRAFPSLVPLDGIDFHRLAKLNISGGSIHNIAMNSAFIAADEGIPVNMKHLKRASELEFSKLERPFVETEIGGC